LAKKLSQKLKITQTEKIRPIGVTLDTKQDKIVIVDISHGAIARI
jgi:hypothetical protein